MTADVIVVGAGPVGLLLAGELRLHGIDVVVYDRLTVPTTASRALGFNRRAAESLDQRGLLSRLGAFRWGAMGHFGGVRIDLSLLDDDHSGVLGLSQVATERLLAGWLAELGVPVRRGYEITGLRQTPDEAVVTFDGPAGPGTDATRYLVGCDGADSTVRALAGIAAPGREATRGMYTAEITGAAPRPRPIGERLPGGSMVVCTPLGDGRFRVVVHDKSLSPRPEPGALTFEQVADAWLRLTGEDIASAQPLWVWACGNASRLADSYRRGRVLLAGDAAHEMPPLAAWGLSAGLQDAVNLGWKLAAVVRGWAPDGLLDSYEAERRRIGAKLIRDARAASMLYLGDGEMDPVRDVLAELLAQPDAAEELAGVVSGLGLRYDMGPAGSKGAGHPLLGLRMPPDRELITPDGRRTRVADLLHAGRGVLIVTGPDDRPAPGDAGLGDAGLGDAGLGNAGLGNAGLGNAGLGNAGLGDAGPGGAGPGDAPGAAGQLAAAWADRIDVIVGRWATAGPPALAAVLIRPDGYVAWASPGSDTDRDTDLRAALERWFGRARSTITASGTGA